MEKSTKEKMRKIYLNNSEVLAMTRSEQVFATDMDTTGIYLILDNPLLKQVGGKHYKGAKFEPLHYNVLRYGKGFLMGCLAKYLLRDKENALEDLNKAKHYIEFLLWFRPQWGFKENCLESYDTEFAEQLELRREEIYLEAVKNNIIGAMILINKEIDKLKQEKNNE